MKNFWVVVALILISTSPAYAGKWSTGTTAPATCTVGDSWTDTDGTADNRFYTCTVTNTWTLNSNQTAIDAKANKASTVMLWSEWGDGAAFTTTSPPIAYNGSLYKCTAPYTKVAGETPDTQTEYFEVVTGSGGGIAHATSDGVYYASRNGAWASLAGVFASPLGSDDNYVTDAEKLKLGSLSGINTGDQDLTGYALTSSVLSKTNTTAFMPTADYHPVPKKYVDDSITASGGYTDEQAQDAAGSMFSGNTETGITVTYDDATGKVDLEVATQSDVNFTSAKDTKLTNIADGAEVNVNADWNASSGDAQILNKPTMPTYGTGVVTALGYAPDATGGFATKASLDLKANSTGISFVASALSDLKILTTDQPINGENIVNDSVSYGDTEDNLRLWSIEKIGSQLATKIGPTGVTYEQLDTNGDVGTSAGQLAIGNHTHTGVYQPADTDIQKDAIVMHFVSDSVITSGHEVDVRVPIPWNATITKSSVVCKEAGSIVIDVWKDTYANYPPTVADTITASAKPTTSTSRTSQDATLTGWTTAVAAGDMLIGHVDSNSTNTECTLTLEVTK